MVATALYHKQLQSMVAEGENDYQAGYLYTSMCMRAVTHMRCNFLMVRVVANPSVENPTL